MRIALRTWILAAVVLIAACGGDRYGLDREEAYALASVAADLRIHEVVDAPNWVVGAFLPEGIFETAAA